MDPHTAVHVAIARLLAIRWDREVDYSNPKTQSQIALVHEHLRRLAFWYQSLAREGESFICFDAAEAIAPLPKFAKAKIETLWEPFVKKLKQKKQPSYWQLIYCQGYIHWAAVQHRIPIALVDLLSPYDPLILLYERGGDFYYHNDIQLATGTHFEWGSVEDYLAVPWVVELDNQLLDDMDKK